MRFGIVISMLLIDSHCHLADGRIVADIDDILQRSRAVGVSEWIVPAVQRSEWGTLTELAQRQPGIHPAYGIHPWYCDNHEEDDLTRLRQRLSGAVALGECGLDFGAGRPDEQVQVLWLRRQFHLAYELDLPVVLHACRSLDRVTQELRPYPGMRGVVHGFVGSRQQVDKLLDLGFYIGLGTRLTFPAARRLREIAASIPVERICLETDAPDQPLPLNPGSRNEPAALNAVLDTLAELRQTSRSELASQCNANTRELYRL